jgi:hypothetical protein
MKQTKVKPPSAQSMTLLSRLLLAPREANGSGGSKMAQLRLELQNIERDAFDDLVVLANLNHVIVRGMETFRLIMRESNDEVRAEWAEEALITERSRIRVALKFLHEICAAFESDNFEVTVIKSLDHWPDLGSDLDLFTSAKPNEVKKLMNDRFKAHIAKRSWGDQLAGKWNFEIPGLSEAVEVHVRRLGQTGEQVAIASNLLERTRRALVDNREFRVPSSSDRILISTLQRMYRHFYFRLCDVVDSAELCDSGSLDFRDLRTAATKAGIWEGVATYLAIVSDYVNDFSGSRLELPQFVLEAARFGGNEIYYAKDFLRVPILPQSAKLYGSQLAGFLRKRQLQSGARLSLLPWLATAALVGQKITGSDKGIW